MSNGWTIDIQQKGAKSQEKAEKRITSVIDMQVIESFKQIMRRNIAE